MRSKLHVAVIGAGAFGGWTALHLLRRGARVTLVDAWGPGNSRASSGGEPRGIRGTHRPPAGPCRRRARGAPRALRPPRDLHAPHGARAPTVEGERAPLAPQTVPSHR